MPGSTGMAGSADRWGRWPTAADLERVAPGRRVMLWAHDHHALLASHAALRTGGRHRRETPDPAGGVIRRAADGSPEGVLYETAARLVSIHLPASDQADLEADIETVGRGTGLARARRLPRSGAALPPTRTSTFSFPAYTHLAETGRLPVRLHASVRERRRSTPRSRAGIRSGAVARRRSRRAAPGSGWQKCFADGSMGSRTAALLEDIEPEARPAAAARAPPRRLDHAARASWPRSPTRAAAAGIATQIHAIGDAAVRAALDVLDPDGRRCPADAPPRACPARPARGPRPVRERRRRGQRAAGPRRVGRDRGPPAVGRPRGDERLPVGVDRADGRHPRVRDGCARRVLRPVARDRAGGPSRGSALAGRHAAFGPRRGALARPGAARRLPGPGAVGARDGPRPAHAGPSGRCGRARCAPSSTTRSSRAGRSRRRARRSC